MQVFTISPSQHGFDADANAMSLAVRQLTFTSAVLISGLLVKPDCCFFKPVINSFTFSLSSVALASHGIFRHDEFHSGVECYIFSPLKPAVNTPKIQVSH